MGQTPRSRVKDDGTQDKNNRPPILDLGGINRIGYIIAANVIHECAICYTYKIKLSVRLHMELIK